MTHKIAVIGSGNAGIISSLMSLNFLRYIAQDQDEPRLKDIEVTVFHDPEIKREIVGQGTTLNVANALY